MMDLWTGVQRNSLAAAMPAFFPESAYLKMKTGQIPDPTTDYEYRLIASYRLDIQAAHNLLGPGSANARLLRVVVPHQWTWISPGYCENGIGYWHVPGTRLVYQEGGQVRSFGISSMISWRGQWYVVHFAVNGQPGTVDSPSMGPGSFGPPGGC
jgi:hypothetical protein